MVGPTTSGCPECGTPLLRGARFCHRCGWDSRNPGAGQAPAARGTAYGRPAWKRRTMAWITAVTTALVLALLLRPADAKGRQPQPGEPAPDFALETLDGQVVRLSDLRGQVVLLNFWATWCPPCREEMPALQAVERLYREKGFRVLAINLDESPATIRSFLEQNGLELTVLLDKDMKVTSRYGILPLPTSFFIDREGRVAYVHERYMDLAFVKGQVEQLLGIR
nr:MAG: hypothetical protein DIU70_06090 [Bacillota bacterium]